MSGSRNCRCGRTSWARGRACGWSRRRRWIRGANSPDAAQQLLNRQQPLGMNQLEQAQFEVEALLLAVVQVVESAQNDMQIACQLFLGEQLRGACGAGALISGDLQ